MPGPDRQGCSISLIDPSPNAQASGCLEAETWGRRRWAPKGGPRPHEHALRRSEERHAGGDSRRELRLGYPAGGATVSVRFWIVAALFHALVAPAAIWLAVRLGRGSAPLWRRALDVAALGALAFGVASLIAPLLGDVRFAQIRFLAQTLFGEGVLVLAWLVVAWTRRRRWTASAASTALLIALLAVYWDAYHHTPENLRVLHHVLDRTRSPQRGTLRVLHLSDLQVWRVGPYEARVVREAMDLQPDLILMTGDYVHPRLTGDGREISGRLRALLRREHLSAPLGVFAVGGDTDGGNEQLFDGLGVRWLANEHAIVPLPRGMRLVLVGLTRASSRMKGAHTPFAPVDRAPTGDLFFVMGHGPDYVMAVAGRRRIDLALAGHTHGGQVVLPFLGPPLVLTRLPRAYAAGGLTDYRGVPLHVSRGTGMERGSAPQLRFLCPPEICLIEVRY
jgi:predicted MPP superfamily phosphohydrolase